MQKVQEPSVRKTLTVATSTSRIPWQPLVGLVALIVVMSMVVVSGQELKHVPPAAPTFVVLHSFAGPPTDGAFPYAGLIWGAAGNLYGTTVNGGTCGFSGHGAVFKLSPSGTETLLHSFTGGAAGDNPYAGLIQDAAGNLYGTTYGGGSSACDQGCGTVFRVSPSGAKVVLHGFTGTDGNHPFAGLIQDAAGNLYGTTAVGGAHGWGVVFKLTPSDSSYESKVRHSFTGGADGGFPAAGLIQDAAGNLYGTTVEGGADGACSFFNRTCGVVFKVSPSGTETVLYRFTGADGGVPFAGLIQDKAGNLYGTTFAGGANGSCTPAYGLGCGVVFKLSPSGAETVLYRFTGAADGANPYAGLVRDAAGNLYGTTVYDGASGKGVVFELIRCSSAPSGYDFKVLHAFTGEADGGYPYAGLIQDAAGNLYGTTLAGGTDGGICPMGCGVVFKLAP